MPLTDRRSPDYLQNLYAYNEWANYRVLAAAAVTEERLRDEVTPGASTPLANLMHILQAQAGWLSFWRGVERERLPAAPAHGGVEWLRDQYQRSQSSCACSSIRSKTHLGQHYHRIAARRGKKRAAVATAHTILVAVYHILSRDRVFEDLGVNYSDERRSHRTTRRLVRRLESPGYRVSIESAA